MRPLYIFDLDGTLALIEHRRHFVERPVCPFCGWRKPCGHDDTPGAAQLSAQSTVGASGGPRIRPSFEADWPAFFAACVDDEPNKPVIRVMQNLIDNDNQVWVFSGRSDEVRPQTEKWLSNHTGLFFSDDPRFRPGFDTDVLVMREAGDFTADHILKQTWYEGMLTEDKQRLVCVFDDRQKVVDMWRSLGVACLQVAPGDF